MPFRSCQPLILLVLLTGWGCGSSDGPQRVPLHGVITAAEISGPLTGTISLQPVSGTSGPAANGMIT
ncbi:MAG: hypothetical protein R3C49_14255, partial [Planctomycetaceae bacterium]